MHHRVSASRNDYPDSKSKVIFCELVRWEGPVVLLEFSISPLGEGESVSAYVARSLEIIDRSGLDYRLHAMGTIVEGELPAVLDVMKQCVDAIASDCDRVTCTAKLDYRKGHEGRLDAKVKSVEEHLGRSLKKV